MRPGQVITLDGTCYSNVAGASVSYVVGGQAATEVACSDDAVYSGGVQVTPVVSGPTGCAYGDQWPFVVQAFACPAPSEVLIACDSVPTCTRAGDVLPLDGACTVNDGPYAGAGVDLVDASQQPVKTITCPAIGETLRLTPMVTLPDTSCQYTGASDAEFTSSCPPVVEAKLTCNPVVCPYSMAPVPLADMCTTDLPGALLAYTINGVAALFVDCPSPGTPVQVKASVEGYLGMCNYDGPLVSINSACKGPEFRNDAFKCTPPKCSLIGEAKDLEGSCTSPLGPVSYYDDSGAQITTVTCPARDSDAVVVHPRALADTSCPIKGGRFTVVAPTCPPASADIALSCQPVRCRQEGDVVPLAGTCTSNVTGANYAFTVNGVPSDSVTCPAVGVTVRVEPSINSIYGFPACSYPASGYAVTSSCAPSDFAEFTCAAPACQQPGQVVNLAGAPPCTNVLKCAAIAYEVDGAPATNFTCPNAGASVSVVPWIRSFGGNPLCNYSGPPMVVKSSCDEVAAPLTLSCPDVLCQTSGVTAPVEGLCTVSGGSGSPAYTISRQAATAYTCPPPGAPTNITATVSNADGCVRTVTFTVASRCWSDAQAQVSCVSQTCTGTADRKWVAAACTSQLPGAGWMFSPATGPYACPATVGEATVVSATAAFASPTPRGGTCSYTATARIVRV
jgi:hypothetical protein